MAFLRAGTAPLQFLTCPYCISQAAHIAANDPDLWSSKNSHGHHSAGV